jgi:hypothetical protein
MQNQIEATAWQAIKSQIDDLRAFESQIDDLRSLLAEDWQIRQSRPVPSPLLTASVPQMRSISTTRVNPLSVPVEQPSY